MTTVVQKSFQYLNSDENVSSTLLPISFHRRSGFFALYERNSTNLHFYMIDPESSRSWVPRTVWSANVFSTIAGVFPIEFLDCFAVLGDTKNGSYLAFVDFSATVLATFPLSQEGGLQCCEYCQSTREFLISMISGDIICLYLKMDKTSKLHVSRKKLFRIKTPDLHVPKQIVVFDLAYQYLILSDKQVIFCIDALTFEVIYSISAELFLIRPHRIIINKCGIDFLILCSSPDGTKQQLEYWCPPSDYTSNRLGCFSRCMIPMSAKCTDVYFETVGLCEKTKLITVLTVDKRMQLWSVNEDSSLSLESDLFVNIPDSIWTKCQRRISAEDRKDRFFVHGHLKKVVNSQYLPLGAFDRFEGPRRRCLLFLLALGSCTIFDIDFPRFNDRLITESFLELERRLVGNNDLNLSPDVPTMFHHDQVLTHNLPEVSATNGEEIVLESALDDDEVSIMSESLAVALESLADLKKDSEQHGVPYHEGAHSFHSTLNSELSSRNGTPSGKVISADLSIGPLEPTIKEEASVTFDDQSSTHSSKRRQDAFNHHQQVLDKLNSVRVKTAVPEIDRSVDPTIFFPTTLYSRLSKSSKPDTVACIQPYGVILNPDDSLAAFSPDGIRPFKSVMSNPSRDLVNVRLLSFCFRTGLVVVVTEFRDCFVYDYANVLSPPLKIPFPLRRTALINDLLAADVVLELPSQPLSKTVQNKIGGVASTDEWIAMFLGDNEGYVHYAVCNYHSQLSKTASFFAHQEPVKVVITLADTTRPLWKVKASLEFQSGQPMLGLEPLPTSGLISMSVSGEVKCWLPSAVGCRGAVMENVFIVSSMQWRLSGIFVIAAVNNATNTGVSESIKRTIQSISLLPSNLTICVGFDNGQLEQWVIPGVINPGGTVATTQQCTWSSSMHSSCVTSIRSFVQSYASETKLVPLSSDGEYDRIMTSLTSYVKVDRRAKFTTGLTFKEMKVLIQASSVVTCSLDKSMIIWGLESVFDVYCSFARPFPCKKFYFSFAPQSGLCFTNDTTVIPNSNQSAETGWVVSMIGNGRIVPVSVEVRRVLFNTIQSEDEKDSRQAIADESLAVTSFNDDMTFDRFSSMTRRKRKILKSLPVAVNVKKASKIVGASKTVELELEKDVSAHDNLRLLNLELLKEWSKVKEGHSRAVIVTEEQTKTDAECGTSRHVPVHDLEQRPKSPNLSLEQLLSDQFHIQSSPTKPLMAHIGTATFGLESVPLPSTNEHGEKIVQNGLYLVAKDHQQELALRTLIIDKNNQTKFVLDKSRPNSPEKNGQVTSLTQTFDDESEILDNKVTLAAAIHINTANMGAETSPNLILDDSPVWTRAPTRAAGDETKELLLTDSTIPDPHHAPLANRVDPSMPMFSITNSHTNRPIVASTLNKSDKKVKYVSKTSLDKLDTKELTKPMTKESRPINVAALKKSKTGSGNDLKIVPSQPNVAPKIDFENSKLLVQIEPTEAKQERSLVLSIPSLHEGDNQPPSAELFVASELTEPSAVQINRAMIPQKFVLKKEKVQAPKFVHPPKSTVRAQTIIAKTEADKHLNDSDANLNLHEDADSMIADESVTDVPAVLTRTTRATMRAPEQSAPAAFITAISPPVMSFSLDLPDQKDEIDKKRAKQVAAILQKKGVEVEAKIDEEPGIRGYFDRNAKPIFLEKATGPKHRLVSKRFDPTAPVTRTNEDDDELSRIVPVIPMEDIPSGMRSPSSNASLGTNNSKKSAGEGSTSKVTSAQQGTQPLHFLNDLEGEDREIIDGLDDRLRDKLLAQLKKAKTGDIRMLKKIAAKIIMESRILQMLKMDMAVDILEVRDRSFRVSVATAYGGSMNVVLMKRSKNGKKPGKERFKGEKDIKAIPGYMEHRLISLKKNDSQQVQFDNLHPSFMYWIYVAVDRTQAEAMASKEDVDMKEITDTSPPVLLEVETAEENLDIEWTRMTSDMRLTELRAAIRSEFIQIKTRFHFPPLVIPDDSDLLNEETINCFDPAKTSDEREEAKTKLAPTLLEFLNWWIGDEALGSRIRGEFHEYEALQMILKGIALRKFLSEGFIDNDDVDVLTKYALFTLKEGYDKFKCHRTLEPEPPHPLMTQGKMTDSERETGLKLFKVFRSWYKGGVVVEDYEEQNQRQVDKFAGNGKVDLKMEDSVSLSSGSDLSIGDRIAVPLTMQRLMERENTLLDFIEAHDKCTDLLKGMNRMYQNVLEKKFTEIMMVQDRGKLAEKDCSAIMGAKKLLTLSVDHMLYDEMELNFMDNKPFPEVDIMKIDPFMFIDLLSVNTPTSIKKEPESYTTPQFIFFERVGGYDVFHAVDIAKLTPDNPPPANVKTLPGSNRRPVKAWQAMTKYDQEVELSLACSLDVIWDLAIEDGIEVPDPEDRSMVFDHFPDRRRVWKLFREWYAGEEDTNPLPGQGVPTLARVVFSEQYELKQIEDDPLLVESMKQNNLPLPLKYREGELDIELLAATFGNNRKNSQVKQRDSSAQSATPGSMASPANKSGRRARPQRQQSSLRKSVFLEENIETMRQAYEQAMNTIAGTTVRHDMVAMTLNKIFESKRMQTLKWVWPPGLNRMGLQYLMPRAGFSIPKFSLPEKRFSLFPLRISDTFNFTEISRWYTETDLDQDDVAMQKAEIKGIKLRAYHEWLAHEPERIEQSRKDMLEEDDVGWRRREIEKVLNTRLANIQEKLLELDEELDDEESELRSKLNKDFIEEQTRSLQEAAVSAKKKKKKPKVAAGSAIAAKNASESVLPAVGDNEVAAAVDGDGAVPTAAGDEKTAEEEDDEASGVNDPNAPIPPTQKIDASFLAKKFFRFGLPLPKEYWYIFEESAEFKYGSGIHNDDEAEEIALEQRTSALKALEAAQSLEKFLNEEKKRRDEEEKNRQKREEQDRRLKEGVLRRRQIRENLEDLKRQRIMKAADEKQKKEEQEMAEKAEKARREEEEREKARLRKIEMDQQRELQQMAQEEIYTRDYKIRMRELHMMEHEDIVSFLQEQIAVREEEKRQAKIRELEEIYTPFEPFKFKKTRIRLPQLHAILREKDEYANEEVFLQEVLDSMTLPGSRSTTSSKRKFSHPQLQHGTHEYFASNKLQEHDTESSIRHRSQRYMSLYGDVKYHPELLHEHPDAVAAEEERRREEERLLLVGEDYDDAEDEDYGYDDYMQEDDFDSRSLHSGVESRDSSLHGRDAGLNDEHKVNNDIDMQLGETALVDSPLRRSPDSPGTLRFDLSGTTGNNGMELRIGEGGDSDDHNSVGGRSFSSASSRGSRRRRRSRPSSSPTKQILAPRQGNNLVQRSVDSFPTREKIQKISRENKRRAQETGDPVQLLSMNPYEGHWMLLERPTPVLYSSAPVLIQATYRGTGVEALTNSPPRSRQRASRLLRPLKKQLQKDLQMIHSATTSVLPGAPPDRILQQVRSSPYLPTALSPLDNVDDTITSLNAQELLRQYTESAESYPPAAVGENPAIVENADSIFQNSLLDTDSHTMSQSSSLFNAGTSHDGKGRKKMHDLLALSSDALAKNDPKAWMKMMKTQRTLALASLTTIEGGGAAKHIQKERQKLIDIGAKRNLDREKGKKAAVPSFAAPKAQKEKPLVDFEFDLIDFKTLKMAHAASETVERLKQQRDRVREYVNSDAVAHDEYFLAATLPGIHNADAIALSPVAETFRRGVMERLHDQEQAELRQSHSAGFEGVMKGAEAFGMEVGESKSAKVGTTAKKTAKEAVPKQKQKLSFVSSVSTVTQSNSSGPLPEKPGSPLRIVPVPGPKAVGALFGSTMKMAPKDKFHGLVGDSQEVVAFPEDKKKSKPKVYGKTDRQREKSSAHEVAADKKVEQVVFRESSLATRPSVDQQHSLSLDEDDELTSSMSIVPLRSSTPNQPPTSSSSTSRPPRSPGSPTLRSRSVKSLDLFIKTPRSARLAGEEIELEVKNTLSLLPSAASQIQSSEQT